MLNRLVPYARRYKSGLIDSCLLNEETFYSGFLEDLSRCKCELIIESPFITMKRVSELMPVFQKLRDKDIRIVVNTKPIEEHDLLFQQQSRQAIANLQRIGVIVLVTGGHHRKLAIIDKAILYEGSLNILSQNDSCEIMRRINSKELAIQMCEYLRLAKT